MPKEAMRTFPESTGPISFAMVSGAVGEALIQTEYRKNGVILHKVSENTVQTRVSEARELINACALTGSPARQGQLVTT